MFRSRSSPSSSPQMCRSRKSTSISIPIPETPTTSTSNSLTPSFTHPPANTSSTSNSSSLLDTSSLRFSLSDSAILYPFSELSASTNSFLSKPLSTSSSPSWKSTLRTKQVIIIQHAFRNSTNSLSSLPTLLSSVCRSHHSSLARLRGISLPPSPNSSSPPDHIYLVYDHIPGASLLTCLRNPHNPNYTPLSKWIHRVKIATDLAQGLDYIHVHCSTIHNHLKSSSVIVADPDLSAKICHFGAADLTGQIPNKLQRSNSARMRIQGTRGYIAPEVISGSPISQRSDIYALGVLLLELISGKDPVKYLLQQTGEYVRLSLIDTARDTIGTEDEDGAEETEALERRARVRRWVDRRLKDSFPVEVAERLIRVALRCVEDEPWMRPDMTWVAGKVSMLYLESTAWDEKMALPTDISVSLAPR